MSAAEEINEAINRPAPWEQDILEACASKMAEEFKGLEDKRIIKELRMALNKQQADQLRRGLMRLKTKAAIVERFIVCEGERLEFQAIERDVQIENRALKQSNSQLEDEVKNETEMMEFWRKQAFNSQNILNDLMTRISTGKEV